VGYGLLHQIPSPESEESEDEVDDHGHSHSHGHAHSHGESEGDHGHSHQAAGGSPPAQEVKKEAHPAPVQPVAPSQDGFAEVPLMVPSSQTS